MDITGIGSAADLVKTIWKTFSPTPPSPEQQLKLQEAVEARDAARDNAKKEVMVAELNQGDLFTKRARPMIVYTGLMVIVANYMIFPQVAFFTDAFLTKQLILPEIKMPTEFWVTWGGVCSIYVMGRTAEKKNMGGKLGALAGLITGNR